MELEKKQHFVKIPKDYLRGPIFAASKQKKGRIIEIKKHDRTYEIGGFDPFSEEEEDPCPALDSRHARLLFTMLSFYEGPLEDNQHKIRFSFNQLCRKYSNSDSNGGRYTRDIRGILRDLSRCWFRITYANGEKRNYRILKDISIHSKPKRNLKGEETLKKNEIWLDEVELHPEFCKFLNDYDELGFIDVKMMSSMKSLLGQAIYTYMPSRIINRGEKNAFSINLSTLLKEVGHNVPNHKSLRKRIFTQNKKSLVNHLNGIPFLNGILRVKLVETVDKSDYKLLFWNGNVVRSHKQRLDVLCPKLRKHWLKSGRTNEEFNLKLRNLPDDLEIYQKENLKRAQIQTIGNEVFMRVAFALVGRSKFDEIVSEVKSLVLEPNLRSPIKNPTKIFISQIIRILSNAV